MRNDFIDVASESKIKKKNAYISTTSIDACSTSFPHRDNNVSDSHQILSQFIIITVCVKGVGVGGVGFPLHTTTQLIPNMFNGRKIWR